MLGYRSFDCRLGISGLGGRGWGVGLRWSLGLRLREALLHVTEFLYYTNVYYKMNP